LGRVLQGSRAVRAHRSIATRAIRNLLIRGCSIQAGFLLLLAADARALPVLDQQNLPPGGPLDQAIVVDSDDISLIQTFSVGVTGQLAGVDLWLGGSFDTGQGVVPQSASVSIVTIDPHVAPQPLLGDPGLELVGQVLASLTAQAPSVDGGLVSLDLSSFGIQVSSGETLGLLVSGFDLPEFGLVFGTDSDSYAGGNAWYRCNTYPFTCGGLPFDRGGVISGGGGTGPGWESSADDAFFRTWVEPVPEPATLALVLVGSAGLAMARRTRNR